MGKNEKDQDNQKKLDFQKKLLDVQNKIEHQQKNRHPKKLFGHPPQKSRTSKKTDEAFDQWAS